MVTFSRANEKLKILAHKLGLPSSAIFSFDLPAGHSCPAADICHTKVDPVTGKMTRLGAVLCYAAKAEALYPNTRNMRWRNFEAVAGCGTPGEVADMLEAGMPKSVKIIRIHSSGDFFRPAYFYGWMILATRRPDLTFFGYTKLINHATAPKPDNFRLNYSFGSLCDKQWNPSIPTCFIGTKPDEYPGVPVVCAGHENGWQDYEMIMSGKSFVIPVH